MFVGTKIEGEPDLKKDKHSKAIINTNTNAYNRYKQHQKSKISEIAEKEAMKKEINILKDDMKDIKSMLTQLLEKE
jgi:hypothetical protein